MTQDLLKIINKQLRHKKIKFNPYIVIDVITAIGNHVNGIMKLADKGISVRQLFLIWALQARWIDYNIDEQKII